MVWQRGARGEAVEIYREPFAAKLMLHFQLARRVQKTENTLKTQRVVLKNHEKHLFDSCAYWLISILSVFFMKYAEDGGKPAGDELPLELE